MIIKIDKLRQKVVLSLMVLLVIMAVAECELIRLGNGDQVEEDYGDMGETNWGDQVNEDERQKSYQDQEVVQEDQQEYTGNEEQQNFQEYSENQYDNYEQNQDQEGGDVQNQGQGQGEGQEQEDWYGSNQQYQQNDYQNQYLDQQSPPRGQAMKDTYDQYQQQFGPGDYEGYQEQTYRKGIFDRNNRLIQQHNRNSHSYQRGVTPLMYQDPQQFLSGILMDIPERPPQTRPTLKAPADFKLQSIDWRNYMNQAGQQKSRCGACYAFSVTYVIQAYYAYRNQEKPKFSQQQLVDCCSTGCYGCKGGWPSAAMDYLASQGLQLSENYPYQAKVQDCKLTGDSSTYRILNKGESYKQIHGLDNTGYALSLGPVSIIIDASQWDPLYKNGIFNQCQNTQRISYNHAVVLAGYTQNGTWLVLNSWGKKWGDQGYIYLPYGNSCGLADRGVIPIMQGQGEPQQQQNMEQYQEQVQNQQYNSQQSFNPDFQEYSQQEEGNSQYDGSQYNNVENDGSEYKEGGYQEREISAQQSYYSKLRFAEPNGGSYNPNPSPSPSPNRNPYIAPTPTPPPNPTPSPTPSPTSNTLPNPFPSPYQNHVQPQNQNHVQIQNQNHVQPQNQNHVQIQNQNHVQPQNQNHVQTQTQTQNNQNTTPVNPSQNTNNNSNNISNTQQNTKTNANRTIVAHIATNRNGNIITEYLTQQELDQYMRKLNKTGVS